MKSVKDTAGLILLLLVIAFVVNRLLGCLPREAKEAAAEVTYLGQQLECVDTLHTKEDIEGCRNTVKRRWLRDAGALDASAMRLPSFGPEWVVYDRITGSTP